MEFNPFQSPSPPSSDDRAFVSAKRPQRPWFTMFRAWLGSILLGAASYVAALIIYEALSRGPESPSVQFRILVECLNGAWIVCGGVCFFASVILLMRAVAWGVEQLRRH